VRTQLVWLAAALATGVAILILSGDQGGGDGQQPDVESAPAPKPSDKPGPEHADHRERGQVERGRAAVHRAVASSPAARLGASEREVARVVRAYVATLNARDGRSACALFVPGALAGVDFPRDRGACAASLRASIGYRDPRGFPVYDRSRIGRLPSVAIDGSDARVTATIVTRFADNREPSVEDDLIYLRMEGERWLIVKPSATLYRAIGVGDIPPQVLAPP